MGLDGGSTTMALVREPRQGPMLQLDGTGVDQFFFGTPDYLELDVDQVTLQAEVCSTPFCHDKVGIEWGSCIYGCSSCNDQQRLDRHCSEGALKPSCHGWQSQPALLCEPGNGRQARDH
ncbi:hypothetical protein WJX84_011445 [Apatococcus fuscideae]|uniref:Uncharacterized protein n=1 Tax=Apatococcus fuscideae TaxID=2026836 RepID=A0AAW1SMD5_9CHLO